MDRGSLEEEAMEILLDFSTEEVDVFEEEGKVKAAEIQRIGFERVDLEVGHGRSTKKKEKKELRSDDPGCFASGRIDRRRRSDVTGVVARRVETTGTPRRRRRCESPEEGGRRCAVADKESPLHCLVLFLSAGPHLPVKDAGVAAARSCRQRRTRLPPPSSRGHRSKNRWVLVL
ncbi:hypothetical protein AAC387_Pa05g0745 [Persea americana]